MCVATKTGMQCITMLPYSMARAYVGNTNHNFITKQDPLRSQVLKYTYLTVACKGLRCTAIDDRTSKFDLIAYTLAPNRP